MCLDIKSIFRRGAGLIKTAVWQLMMNLSLAELRNWNRPVHPSLPFPVEPFPVSLPTAFRPEPHGFSPGPDLQAVGDGES